MGLGLGQTIGSLEQMNRGMAEDVDEFHDSQPVPSPEQEDSLLVLTADGKGVPMRRDPKQDAPAPSGRLKKGQKAGKKREACVGGVYTVAPETSEEDQDKLFEAFEKKLYRIIGAGNADKVFFNHDPRGYSMKIKEDISKSWPGHKDFGGYGILAPDFTPN